MYQCVRSLKCISIYRLSDGIYDCPDMDDENVTLTKYPNFVERVQRNYFYCQESKKYIHQSLVLNNICDCETNEPEWCEDEDEHMMLNYIRRNISFKQFVMDTLN